MPRGRQNAARVKFVRRSLEHPTSSRWGNRERRFRSQKEPRKKSHPNEKFEASRLPNNNDLAAPTQIGPGPGAIASLAKPPVDRASRTATHYLSGEHSLLREQ